mmetsp:Transcript_18358/g.16228  ORF Transcript_18358/g.16228 Transcript_18358/m.16228 type:complete len:142 (+) Transcript_18358:612-1037(+)
MQNENFKKLEEHLESILDKVETYIHSVVNGIQKLSLKIRCPEKLKTMLEKAKNMTSNFHEAFDNYIGSISDDAEESYYMNRMNSLKSLSNKVSKLLHKAIKENSSDNIPDITFSSYFESPGEILNDVTRVPLFIHLISAIF